MNSKIFKYILIAVFCLFCVLIVDYYNILYFISKNLNYDFLNIFVNALIIITMFCITYILIDKRTLEIENEKKRNKSNALYIMLMKTYMNCQNTFYYIENPEILKKYIVPKCNFKTVKDEFLEMKKNYPFELDCQIIDLLKDGCVSKETVIEYFNIKDMYKQYLTMKITFFDIEEYNHEDAKVIKEVLENKKNDLHYKLNQEIKKIKSALSFNKE